MKIDLTEILFRRKVSDLLDLLDINKIILRILRR